MFKNAVIVGTDIEIEKYCAQTVDRGHPNYVMSRGELMEFLVCPSRWLAGYKKDETPATTYGTLIDTIALTPKKFGMRYVVAPPTYPVKATPKDPRTEKPWNWNANHCIEWREKEEGKGKTVITTREMADATQAGDALKKNWFATDILKVSKKQMMIVAEYSDAFGGPVVPVKVLLDFVPKLKSKYGKKLGDFKSTVSADPEDFEKSIYNYHYDAQAYLNKTLYELATGEDRPDWQFLIQENYPPFECPDIQPLLSSEFLEIGSLKINRALKAYAQCIATGKWPSYSTGTRMVIGNSYIAGPPLWAAKQMIAESPILK